MRRRRALPIVLIASFLWSTPAFASVWATVIDRLPTAALITLIFALAALAAGVIGKGGAAVGIVLGVLVFTGMGSGGFALLALFVTAGSIASRLSGGRAHRARGARHAIANLGLPCAIAVLSAFFPSPLLRVSFCGALAAALADTLSSEIGIRCGGLPRLIVGWRLVPPGTDGGITWPGTLAGAAGGLLVGVTGYIAGLTDLSGLTAVALGGFAGTLADSVLGATLERAGRLGNSGVNFLATVAGAATALLIYIAGSDGIPMVFA